ncbi:MAG: hypothetical protein LBD29_05660 [Treponema sp.]|jgi:hypothetical protein|nr:hypothetical protein [Treponema sp.]
MIQFYFLSILCNATAGYILISDREQGDKNAIDTDPTISAKQDTFRLVLGILTMITGLFKLLSVIQGDLPVVGDIIPALLGFGSGSVLLVKYYRKNTTFEPKTFSLFELFLDRYKKQIGYLAVGAAILHFLFPQALLI